MSARLRSSSGVEAVDEREDGEEKYDEEDDEDDELSEEEEEKDERKKPKPKKVIGFARAVLHPTSSSSSSSSTSSSSSKTNRTAMVHRPAKYRQRHSEERGVVLTQLARASPLLPVLAAVSTLAACAFPQDLLQLIVQFCVPFVDLGNLYEKRGDWPSAFEEWQDAMQIERNPTGAYKIACCYMWGMNCVHVDERHGSELMLEWLPKCSGGGGAGGDDYCVFTASLLADSYWNGLGIKKDEERSVVLWREYSDRDHFAGVFYANRLLDGDHADKDEAAGAALRAKWLPKIYDAARDGDVRARSYLSQSAYSATEGAGQACLTLGMTLPLALEWGTDAATQGSCEAQFDLARHYECVAPPEAAGDPPDVQPQDGTGKPWFTQTEDHKTSMRWLTAAATQGMVMAQRNLGCYYATGELFGGVVDLNQTMLWYKRARDQGEPDLDADILRCERLLGIAAAHRRQLERAANGEPEPEGEDEVEVLLHQYNVQMGGVNQQLLQQQEEEEEAAEPQDPEGEMEA